MYLRPFGQRVSVPVYNLYVLCYVNTAWARYTIIANREFIITASALVVTLPLSLYRNISRLVKVCAHISLPLNFSRRRDRFSKATRVRVIFFKGRVTSWRVLVLPCAVSNVKVRGEYKK